ncbi:MAG: NYN domain-containing protein [Promethearchaeota archaeon]
MYPYQYISDLKKERDILEKVREGIALSQGLSPNLFDFQNLDIVLDSQKILDDLKQMKDNLYELKSQIELEIPIIEELVKDKIKKEKKKVLFNGEKFNFFVFDINNLHHSFKKKFSGKDDKIIIKNLLEKELSNLIKKLVLPSTGVDYIAYFFASKAYDNYQHWFPESKYITWVIENTVKYWKNDNTPHYMDIDVSLTMHTTLFIEQYRNQIDTFTLCSGDKDFHSLISLAKRYGIRVNVCAVAYTFLARKLERMADDTILLT